MCVRVRTRTHTHTICSRLLLSHWSSADTEMKRETEGLWESRRPSVDVQSEQLILIRLFKVTMSLCHQRSAWLAPTREKKKADRLSLSSDPLHDSIDYVPSQLHPCLHAKFLREELKVAKISSGSCLMARPFFLVFSNEFILFYTILVCNVPSQ